MKFSSIVILVAAFLGGSGNLHATTVDVSKITESMCKEMIPSNSNSVKSNACEDALDQCQEDLSGQLLFSINHYNEWAKAWNKEQISQQNSSVNYFTTPTVFADVIQDEFITQHERANIVLGGQFGNTKNLFWEAFQSPGLHAIMDTVKNGCKKVDEATPAKQGAGDASPSDPNSGTPKNDGNSGGAGSGDAPNPPSGNDANVNSQGAPSQVDSPTLVTNTTGNNSPGSTTAGNNSTGGGGCSMTDFSTAGGLGSFLFLLSPLLVSIFRKRK